MKRNVELVVISDVHLGTYGCKAKELLRYLNSIQPKTLVLNGDIIDIWQFKKSYFPKPHLKVIRKILSLATKNTDVYYITGNHDEMFRKFTDFELGKLKVCNKICLNINDKKTWIFHGDVFDASVQHSKWIAKLGGKGYDLLIVINNVVNWFLEKMGREKYSFSKKIKNNVKKAVKYIGDFELTASELAIDNHYDYVVCGHIHQPQIREVANKKGSCVYMNSGDWIENLSALEYHDNEWRIFYYDEHKHLLKDDVEEIKEIDSTELFKNRNQFYQMKVLYAFQGTGNGHVARAQEIVPILKKYASVDTLISGHQSQLKADFDVNFQYRGVSLLYNKTGGLSYRKTFTENNFLKAVKDIQEIELSKYDLIINDYEPLTGWACQLKKLPMIELSHQASMLFKETPRPEKKDFLGDLILKYYVPSKRRIGFHFESYHPQIKKPVIRHKIRNLNPEKKGFYLVYLPSFSDENIMKVLKQIPVQWKVFSKYSRLQFRDNNVEIFPIDEFQYLKAFENCEGILCNAGFESPAEALFMDKKLFVIPIHNQYEQECNACALDRMGIPNSKVLDAGEITNWVNADQHIKVDYPDDIEEILVSEVLAL